MLVRTIQRRSVNRFKSGAKIAAKFADNINYSGWEILAQRRMIARICALLKAYNGAGLESDCYKQCHQIRDYHNWNIRNKRQSTDVGKCLIPNRTIKSRKQLRAGVLVSFRCKRNTFRSRLKNVVTSKGIQVGIWCT